MSKIWLKEFGGMVPRIGEEHLSARRRIEETGYFPGRAPAFNREIMSWPHATEAQNCHLLSGELRPLKQPQLSYTFCRPGDACWRSPVYDDPSVPVPNPPEEPPACVAVAIQSYTPAGPGSLGDLTIGDPITLTIGVNATATTPLQYQWFRNGIALPGETAGTYSFNAAVEDAYSFINAFVQNPCGSEESLSWHIGAVT